MTEIYDELAKMIGEELSCAPPTLHPDTPLEDIAGWDSVGLAGILVAIEMRYGVVASRDQIDSLATAGDLAALSKR